MRTITTELVETGEKRDTRGRRVTASARREQLLESYARSGLTMAAFARREAIKYPTFASWVKTRKNNKRAPIEFAQVRLPFAARANEPDGERMEVRLPDGTVLCGNRAAELAALVRALRS